MGKGKKMALATCGVILVMLGVLMATNPSHEDWIEWQIQHDMDGRSAGNDTSYSWARDMAYSNPYENDVLFSIGTIEGATDQLGYVGILGHWIKAKGPSTQLTSQGRIPVNNPYIGFWGWLYKTFHTSSE